MTNEKAIEELKGIKSAYSNKQQFHEACLMRSEHEALDMAIKALEQEQSGDFISREAVLDELNKWDWQELYLPIHFKENIIDVVPSVNPQEPKTGHWEWVQYDYNPKIGNWHCSECRCIVVECVGKKEKGGIPLYKYCPQCGAKMIEPQESEE